jgi:hypothetical protein
LEVLCDGRVGQLCNGLRLGRAFGAQQDRTLGYSHLDRKPYRSNKVYVKSIDTYICKSVHVKKSSFC